MTVRFLDQVSDLVQGPPGLATAVAEQLRARPPFPSTACADAVRDHVVEAFLRTATERLREPLREAIADHLAEARSVHEALEGEEPTTAAGAAVWFSGLRMAYGEALIGSDVEGVLGPVRTATTVRGFAPADLAEALTGLVLAEPVANAAPVLARLGVTEDAVAALVMQFLPGSAMFKEHEAPETVYGVEHLADDVAEYIALGGDADVAREAVDQLLTADEGAMAWAVSTLEWERSPRTTDMLGWVVTAHATGDLPSVDEVLARCAADQPKGGDPYTNGVHAADSNRDDSAAAGEGVRLSPAAQPAEPRRRRTPGSAAPTSLSRAAGAALAALNAHSALTEQQVADLAGVSRAAAKKIAAGDVNWEPDDAVLRDLLAKLNALAIIFAQAHDAMAPLLSINGETTCD